MDALLFLSGLGVILHFMAPGVALEDSGEFATAAVTLSITHEPGYPFHVLLGKLFSFLPAGSPAFRLNLLSGVCVAATVPMLRRIICRLAPGAPLLAALTSLSFIFVPALMTQAVLSDKYSMNVALCAGLAALMLKIWREGPGPLPLLGLLGGVAFAHHMQVLYLVPAFAGVGWACRLHRRPRLLLILAFLGALGLSMKVVGLPLLSRAAPSVFAYKLDKAADLAGYLSARSYSGRFEGFSTGQKMRRFWDHGVRGIARQAGYPALALAALGGWFAWKTAMPFLVCGFAGTGIALGLIANLHISGIDYYLLPGILWIQALAGMGLARISRSLGRLPAAAALVLLAAGVLSGGHSGGGYSRYYGAMDWGRNFLGSLGPNAVLVTNRDDDYLHAAYLQRVLGERTDVVLAHRPFMTDRLAHREVERLHPGFTMLRSDLVPWGRKVSDDSPITFFLLSHYGKRDIAFTYLATAEASEGFLLTPSGCVFRAGRRESDTALPGASAFATRLRRFRLRSAYDADQGNFRMRLLAMGPSVLWAHLGTRWRARKVPGEVVACFRRAVSYPVTCVLERAPGWWEVRLRYD